MSKYGNVPTVTDDGRFDSKAELARWQELKLLERAGEITGLRRQVRFALDCNGVQVAVYVADFCYSDPRTGKMTVEDTKGVKTAVYRLKKRMMLACHGIEIFETE